jgi:hypothetical protein
MTASNNTNTSLKQLPTTVYNNADCTGGQLESSIPFNDANGNPVSTLPSAPPNMWICTPPSCTAVDCAGSWGVCESNCQETYTITTPASCGGAACSESDGATQNCPDGTVCSALGTCSSGACVISLQDFEIFATQGSIQLNSAAITGNVGTNAPSPAVINLNAGAMIKKNADGSGGNATAPNAAQVEVTTSGFTIANSIQGSVYSGVSSTLATPKAPSLPSTPSGMASWGALPDNAIYTTLHISSGNYQATSFDITDSYEFDGNVNLYLPAGLTFPSWGNSFTIAPGASLTVYSNGTLQFTNNPIYVNGPFVINMLGGNTFNVPDTGSAAEINSGGSWTINSNGNVSWAGFAVNAYGPINMNLTNPGASFTVSNGTAIVLYNNSHMTLYNAGDFIVSASAVNGPGPSSNLNVFNTCQSSCGEGFNINSGSAAKGVFYMPNSVFNVGSISIYGSLVAGSINMSGYGAGFTYDSSADISTQVLPNVCKYGCTCPAGKTANTSTGICA